MKKILILGILAILASAAITNVVIANEKDIDTNEFSFGDWANFDNATSKEVTIGEDGFNNEANIFVYNNATYDFVTFDVTAGKDPVSGEYPSNVMVDLGNNGRPEYYFGGYGVGQWGNQTNFMSPSKSSMNVADIYPSEDGEVYYVKLPSEAVVNSASVNMTHPAGSVSRTVRIPTSADWSYARYYYYNYYPYGYVNYYYRNYYIQQNYYPISNYYNGGQYPYRYSSGYPRTAGYLEWNTNDPNLAVPAGANIQDYYLTYPVRMYTYRTILPGDSSYYYHIGERTYSVYALTQQMRNYNQYSGTIYYSQSTVNSRWDSYTPDNRLTAEDSYTFNHYRSSSSANVYIYPTYDLIDLVEDWNDGSVGRNGVMITMSDTPHDTHDGLHNNYDQYYRNAKYYYLYRRGYMYGPSASSSYNAYKPTLTMEYSLDSVSPWMDVANDGVSEWSYDGYFNGSQIVSTPSMATSMNSYLTSHFPDEVDNFGNEWTYVPVKIGAEAAGKITVSDFQVEYDYTASVFYNPTTDTTSGELQSIVPSTEEGWSLMQINSTSDTQGTLLYDNLELRGQKPNYRPTTMEIPQIDTEEGAMRSDLLLVNDHFDDIDQEDMSLNYIIQMNDQSDHLELELTKDIDGMTWLGIDTSMDENWNGEVTCQLSATDDFGKAAWSNEFIINVEPVNDVPYTTMEIPDLMTHEGIDPILLEYTAPSGRDIARGKETFIIGGDGTPYFADIEMEKINLDFELLDQNMEPLPLERSNEDGYKVYMDEDNRIYLTVLPPEYTEDPDNYLLILGSDPDFTTIEGSYYLNIYASDDPNDLLNQTVITVEVHVDSVNDPPAVLLIPDVIMNEDQTYVSTVPFIEEYITDIDNDLGDMEVMFKPSDDNVMVSLNEDGLLVVDLGMDFNGVVPVTMEVSDGENIVTGTFNVRIRSINDPPVLVVSNLYNDQLITGLYRIKGSADDIEKNLKFIEVAVTKAGEILYADDWITADGAYVWQYLLDIRDLDDGEYLVFIRAFDGRDFSELLEFNIVVEGPKPPELSDAPVVTIGTAMTGDLEGSITVEGTVWDDSDYVSFVEYRIDGGIWRKAALITGDEWRIVVDTNTLSNEEHNLSVRAYDEKSYSNIEFKRFVVYNEDSDGDGIPNDLEKALLMDPFNKLDGTMDFDNDGFSNQEELIQHNTDPFDGNSHIAYEGEEEPLLDTWAIIFIAAAIICAIVIIGLFILNIRLERNMHTWREDLNRRRIDRKPKTLLQKIVEIAPSFIGAPLASAGPALPGQPVEEQAAALPPMQEGDMNPPA